ncbi:MAG TPA: prepilin-type N-terminal cleavage/methylation domain-containing protein [Planctomycetota bacterium]
MNSYERNHYARMPRGMSMLELAVVVAIFSLFLTVTYSAMLSMRAFLRTNSTQVELQEEARQAMEQMVGILQNAGRFMDTSANPNVSYPKLFNDGKIPNGYKNANQHPAKQNPKAKPGSNANGIDPTLASDEIIFRVPQLDLSGMPSFTGSAINWDPAEYGFFIVPQLDASGNPVPNGYNNLEYRNSSVSQQQKNSGQPVQGEIIARYVDRLKIDECNPYATTPQNDPSLTHRQLRLTLVLSRVVGTNNDSVITVVLSTVVDMRNSNTLE